LEAFVVELEVADLGVVEVLDAADVEADVVAGPVLAELVAASGELADEVAEVAVVGVAAGGRAQRGDDVVRDAVPVEVEVAGARGSRKTNRAAFGFSWPSNISSYRARPSGLAARMSRRSLPMWAAAPVIASSSCCTEGRMRCLVGRQRGGGPIGWAARARSKRCARSASSSCSARASASRTLSDAPARSPRSRARVVGDADAGQDGDLLASQDAAGAVVGRADVGGLELGPAGGEELADLAARVHRALEPRAADRGDPASVTFTGSLIMAGSVLR
jgi:hypothetical protein